MFSFAAAPSRHTTNELSLRSAPLTAAVARCPSYHSPGLSAPFRLNSVRFRAGADGRGLFGLRIFLAGVINPRRYTNQLLIRTGLRLFHTTQDRTLLIAFIFRR